MTDIKNAIGWFESFVGFYSLSEDEKKMFDTAIRSLQAWEVVLHRLEKEREEILNSSDYENEIVNYCLYNFDKAINIIKQMLRGVENEQSK